MVPLLCSSPVSPIEIRETTPTKTSTMRISDRKLLCDQVLSLYLSFSDSHHAALNGPKSRALYGRHYSVCYENRRSEVLSDNILKHQTQRILNRCHPTSKRVTLGGNELPSTGSGQVSCTTRTAGLPATLKGSVRDHPKEKALCK